MITKFEKSMVESNNLSLDIISDYIMNNPKKK